YVGAFYTGRIAADPPGTMRPVGILHEGLGNYSTAAPPARNRWGDYGGIAADPALGWLWLFHMYAADTNVSATWVGALDLRGSEETTTATTSTTTTTASSSTTTSTVPSCPLGPSFSSVRCQLDDLAMRATEASLKGRLLHRLRFAQARTAKAD